MRARLTGLSIVATAFLAGCSVLPSPADGGPTPPPGAVVVPADQMTLSVANSSILPVSLIVNGSLVADVPPHDGLNDIARGRLPALPWAVEMKTPSGRVLLSMTIRAGDVWRLQNADGSTKLKGAGNRVDLSCGRIDVWSGPGMLGPAPGPGVPGDCAP